MSDLIDRAALRAATYGLNVSDDAKMRVRALIDAQPSAAPTHRGGDVMKRLRRWIVRLFVAEIEELLYGPPLTSARKGDALGV